MTNNALDLAGAIATGLAMLVLLACIWSVGSPPWAGRAGDVLKGFGLVALIWLAAS